MEFCSIGEGICCWSSTRLVSGNWHIYFWLSSALADIGETLALARVATAAAGCLFLAADIRRGRAANGMSNA